MKEYKNIFNKEQIDVHKHIKEWAKEDFENGQVMDSDDYNEFASILKEDGYKPSEELFDEYFKEVDNAREEFYSDNESDDVEDDE
jgi:hypothetical protein